MSKELASFRGLAVPIIHQPHHIFAEHHLTVYIALLKQFVPQTECEMSVYIGNVKLKMNEKPMSRASAREKFRDYTHLLVIHAGCQNISPTTLSGTNV